MSKLKKPTATDAPSFPAGSVRTGMSTAEIKQSILDNLHAIQGRPQALATRNDWYMALAYSVRDRMMDRWCTSTLLQEAKHFRMVSYLSAEYLLGPHLGNCLLNLGLYEQVREAVESLGLDLDDLLEQEEEPGLGNGGLGRLAACYLDSLATLSIPSIGYGIRYEFGIFDQVIRDGWQVEITDKWLGRGNPWEIARPEIAFYVKLGGHTEPGTDETGRYHVRWVPDHEVKGIAYDTPVAGYGKSLIGLLRLWKSEAVESFDFQTFNVGDYYGAVDEKIRSETISKVLYPNDAPETGKLLRLTQQYFFVSCSLQDMIRIHLLRGFKLEDFHESWAAQLNDTHPSIAVAELMRLLIDVHGMDWNRAWHVTQSSFAYTNHTLLPEALEKWPLPLFARLLPRHMEIIHEINRRFLDDVRTAFPVDGGLAARLSLIEETGEKFVRMAHLASLGSHAVNGVAELHSELLKRDVLRDFYTLYPEKFLNITNGVTPRRWLALYNPRLAGLITGRIGTGWIDHLESALCAIEPLADDEDFRRQWREVKLLNKRELAACIRQRTGVDVDPGTLFDIQVKRIHEYKRQHLNILHVITLYNRIQRNPACDMIPRTVIFGGKAAPGYFMAKLIIKLINSVADTLNSDPAVANRLKVVFLPDFNVKNSRLIYPAADLSEQISTAGKEADSSPGNVDTSA